MLDTLAAWWHRIDAAAMAVHEGAASALPALGILAIPLGAAFAGPLVLWLLGGPEEPFRWPFRSNVHWSNRLGEAGEIIGERTEAAPAPGAGSSDDWI